MANPVDSTAGATIANAEIEAILGTRSAGAVSERPARLLEAEIRQISMSLNRMGNERWSKVPRLYAVLTMVGDIQVIDAFISQGVSDLWFPFSHQTLPQCLRSPSTRFKFLEYQDLVLTKALDLEREDGKHRHFLNADDVPLRKLEELGKGGFGYVDRVVSTITFKEYARKLIPRGRNFKKNVQVLRDFERELGNLKKLSHIHIVELIGSYTDPKFVGIIMAPVADYNLKDFLDRDNLPAGDVSFLRTFFGCIAGALSYLHDQQIRHKDIKPQNVLVKGHQVFLTDFGISLDWSDLGQSTTTGATIKTPRYCAPEVAEFLPRNTLSDLWSLGCVYVEIWTVLRGETISRFCAYLADQGTKSTCYYLNVDSVFAWCTSLRAQARSKNEDPPLAWIKGTLQVDQNKRWTSRELVDHIAEVNEDPEIRYAFSGTCCIHDSSTDSDVSSNRYSKALDETGASSLEVYQPKSQTPERSTSSIVDLNSSVTIRPFSAVGYETNDGAGFGEPSQLPTTEKDVTFTNEDNIQQESVQSIMDPSHLAHLEGERTSFVDETLRSKPLNDRSGFAPELAPSSHTTRAAAQGPTRQSASKVPQNSPDPQGWESPPHLLPESSEFPSTSKGQFPLIQSTSKPSSSTPEASSSTETVALVTSDPISSASLLAESSVKGSPRVPNSKRWAINSQTFSSPPQTTSPPQSTPSPRAKSDLTSWWKKFRRTSEKSMKETSTTGIFGVPLQISIRYANVAISLTNENGEMFIYGYVPIVVAKCGTFLKEKASTVQDIFYQNGLEKHEKELQVIFDSPDRYGKGLNWSGYSVHDAAGVLVRYLKSLPEPLVPLESYPRWIQSAHLMASLNSYFDKHGSAPPDQRIHIARYQRLTMELPPLNRQLLLYILDLLAVFSSKSDLNRMTAKRLAPVFQSSILSHPELTTPVEITWRLDVVIFLIENQDHFLIGMTKDVETEKGAETGT